MVGTSRSTNRPWDQIEAAGDVVYLIPLFVLIPATGISTIRDGRFSPLARASAWVLLAFSAAMCLHALVQWGG